MRFFDKYIPGKRKLNLNLLWDYDTNNINPNEIKRLIITRIIKIGKLEDFYAAFDTYGGLEGVTEIVKKEVSGLTKKELNFICFAFNLKKEETECYKKEQLRKKHFNS